jgi:hypothetical protein
MVAGGAQTAALARDTIFATVMIILNGIIGRLCRDNPREEFLGIATVTILGPVAGRVQSMG